MSGHSKWSQVKRQKGVADVKRGQTFTKLGREITIAAREGGGADPSANPRLRLAVQRARDANMPSDTIERATKRGAGAVDGAALERVLYEGYGPGGVALLIDTLTDNRKRAVAEIRSALTRGGGNLGEAGCVAWNFEPKGVINVAAQGEASEELPLAAIDAGAEDFHQDSDALEIITAPQNVESVRKTLEARPARIISSEVAMVPKATVQLPPDEAATVLRLMERLEALDDVQHVYTNLDISEEALRVYSQR